MELIQSWILSVTVSAMIIALAEALMPPGTVKRVAKLMGGLVLMLGVLQPLVRMDYDELFVIANGMGDVTIAQAEEAQASGNEFLKSVIEEELDAYVLDKAQSLGASCTVSVTCALGENGVPCPERVTVRGLSDADVKRDMRLLLRDELGIPYEKQTYVDEELP